MAQVVTKVGLNAVEDAKVNGFRISITKFALTLATGFVADETDEEPVGKIEYEGRIDVVEELTGEAACLFTVQVRQDYPQDGSKVSFGELALYLDNGTMFSHGPLEPVYEKDNSFAIRFRAVVALEGLADVINVTVTDTHSIPSVARVATLPPPKDVIENTISVLDEWENPFGRSTPSLAVRYGAGSDRWGYVGWDLVYEGPIDSVDGKNFYCNPDRRGFKVENYEAVIVQEAITPNSSTHGNSHKFVYKGNGLFKYKEGTVGIRANSTVAIWRRQIPILDPSEVSGGVKIYGTTRISYYNTGTLDVGLTGDQDDIFLVWADGVFFGAGYAKESMDTSSIKTGTLMDVFLIRTRVLNDGETPDILTRAQYDYHSIKSKVLTHGKTGVLEDFVLVFKDGKLLRKVDYDADKKAITNWTVNTVDGSVTLSDAQYAASKTSVMSIVLLIPAEKAGVGPLQVSTITKVSSGEREYTVPGMSLDSSVLFYDAGGIIEQGNYSINASTKTLNCTYVPVLGHKMTAVLFYNTALIGSGYFFAQASEISRLLEEASIADRKLRFVRHNGETFDVALPPNYVEIPIGGTLTPAAYGEGLIGVDAYDSPDMPTYENKVGSQSKLYQSGLSMLHKTALSERGFQFSVEWDEETEVPTSAFLRIKDDTKDGFGAWRRLAWADEVAAVAILFNGTSSAVNTTLDDTTQRTQNLGNIDGGTGPYTVSGTMPAGTSLSVSGASVILTYTGSASAEGVKTVSFNIKDAKNKTGTGVFTYTVGAASVLPASAFKYGVAGQYILNVTWDGYINVGALGGCGAGGNGASGSQVRADTVNANYPQYTIGDWSAGGGGGGGSGYYANKFNVPVKKGDVVTIVVGAGGAPSYSNTATSALPASTEWKSEHQPIVTLDFSRGSNGSPSYVQVNGVTVLYVEGGVSGESGKITAKHFYGEPLGTYNMTYGTGYYGDYRTGYYWLDNFQGYGGAGGAGQVGGAAGGYAAGSRNTNVSQVFKYSNGASASGGAGGTYQSDASSVWPGLVRSGGNGGAGSAAGSGGIGGAGEAGAVAIVASKTPI